MACESLLVCTAVTMRQVPMAELQLVSASGLVAVVHASPQVLARVLLLPSPHCPKQTDAARLVHQLAAHRRARSLELAVLKLEVVYQA